MGLFNKTSTLSAKPAAKKNPNTMKPADLSETLFNMKFTAKQMGRLAKKAHSSMEAEKKKCKKAIEESNVEGAKIHAENAVRNEKQEISYMRLQSRLDAVVSKLEAHTKMMTVTASMGDVSYKLDEALQTMDINKITAVMDTFEKQFENLDLNAQYMDSAIGESVASSVPQNEVNTLLQQVGEEHNLEVSEIIGGPKIPGTKTGQPSKETTPGEIDSLEEKLRNL
uniref:Uncharacterized protein n=1 Tax=Rhodosorus marinus TaxID=101924 RepID=A0A7S0G4U7_9RHOD|mmetsp:Transcript_23838/g.34263  ORF Transcript_23838/g.34263 Transcript_23838/m.34263 type:complete len:225 (+) Transcript_23838:186-860(+)